MASLFCILLLVLQEISYLCRVLMKLTCRNFILQVYFLLMAYNHLCTFSYICLVFVTIICQANWYLWLFPHCQCPSPTRHTVCLMCNFILSLKVTQKWIKSKLHKILASLGLGAKNLYCLDFRLGFTLFTTLFYI